MKKLIVAGITFMGLMAGAGAASGADLPRRSAPLAPVQSYAPPLPIFTWTGFYLGVQAGYAFGEDDARLVDGSTSFGGGSFDTDGFVVGAHAGFNYQFGSFVVGVEGDLEATGLEGDLTLRNVALPGDTLTASTEMNVQGSLRGRLGFALDRLLIYGTGGLAFANFDNQFTYTAPGLALRDSFDETQWGWTLGAGVEYAFTTNLTARVEYRYTQFDSFRTDLRSIGLAGDQEPDFHAIRAGVSYKF